MKFNLFAGSIIGLAGDDQQTVLETMQVRDQSRRTPVQHTHRCATQDEGTLGCFALTERSAGVNSGGLGLGL